MQSVTIDILNSKALVLLKDLEDLHLIRMHNEARDVSRVDWVTKYKGAMSQQSISSVDEQLDKLRAEWD